jgi:hypothetical protein
MSRKSLFLAAALLAVAPAAAFAQNGVSYPRTVDNGGSVDVDYGPAGPQGNIVGGGATRTQQVGSSARITYLDNSFAQTRNDGQVPVTVGAGENAEIVWLPASEATPAHAQAALRNGNNGRRG